ncbi:L-aspartate oxidase [Brucella oryzae]|uniref:L-aspartate oxidase n=1 Tax=Brucella oryzae TaxID=335286 RepID=A0A2S7IYL2_9HYPH|nr:L-aspartate oxidase [Brucella oryzae]MBR7651010.1 L-aspartate oxidase [Brucella oryzae]PQA73068.1 L-aspartate oxidase [Brucella oryzae]
MNTLPVLVIGSGLAGLMTALTLSPQPVLLVTVGNLGLSGSSTLAQGGIAASVGADDSTALHLADTIVAGDGLCDAGVAAEIIAAGAEVVAALEAHGVHFDRKADGSFSLGLEAAHSRHRIVHVDGDATGAGIVRALIERVLATPSITLMENTRALRLLRQDDRVVGASLENVGPVVARAVVLATGGIGGLYQATTTPLGNLGQGAALAGRAGAVLADMEFVQFHPTALAVSAPRLPLISEAVRGEGAQLVNDRGERFMGDIPGRELAPRDVVARAIGSEIAQGRKVFLDARAALGARFASRFPGIDALCRQHGIDPAMDMIPVRPATHYHMGGIRTDGNGRSSLPGLWAVGEAACTGLHGANRLASNSLLEAAAMGLRAARALGDESAVAVRHPVPVSPPQNADPEPVRRIVSNHLGLLRDEEGLRSAITTLLLLAETDDAAAVALVAAVAAFERRESRGSHARTDYPAKDAAPARSFLTFPAAFALAREIAASHPVARIA